MNSLWSRTFLRISVLTLFLLTIAVTATRLHAEDNKTEVLSSDSEAVDTPPPACTGNNGSVTRKLSGVVTDQTGAAVRNAQITVTCGVTTTNATTDATGNYSLTVPAGRYQLRVEAPNFNGISQNITVNDVALGTVINPILHVGQLKSTVTVTAGNEYATSVSSGGTKTDLPLAEVPQAITVVNRDLMNAQLVVKLDDALKNVAGVMAGGYYDGWDYYRIRGFDASFNTYIDGLRGGNGVSEETWGLESVEVLKGPSSALYGQSVLGGLVNIITRKPVPATFAHVQFTGGTFKFLDPAIDVGTSNASHTLYGRLAALYHSADGFVDYSYRHRYYFAPSLTWRPDTSTSLTLIGRIQRDNGRNGMPLPAQGTVQYNPNGPIPISTYIGELEANANKLSQGTQQFGYQFSHSFGEHFTLRQNARFAWYQQDWNRIYYPDHLDQSDLRTLYRYPLDWHGPWQTHVIDTNAEAHGNLFGMEHNALLGVEFFRNPTIAKGAAGAPEPLDLYHPVYGANPYQATVPYTDSESVTQYTGIYLQDHIRLPQHVTITAGGRVDFAKNETLGSPNQNSTGLTPRLGVTWQFIPSTSVYASFSKSFMPQSGMVYDGSNSGKFISPERGQQWEGGAKSNFWNGRISATVAIFQLNRLNVATADQSHPNFYLVTGQQRSRGVEFEATLHPLAGWNITSAYSYINAIVTDDTSIPYGTPTLNAPKNIFNIWSTYEVPRGPVRGLSFGIGGRHYTDQAGDLTNSFQIPGYGLVDASATYHRGHSQWQFNVNNLTNARYFAGSYNNVYVKPGEPRVFRGTVSWNF